MERTAESCRPPAHQEGRVCSVPSSPINFPENNEVDDVVTTITVEAGVTLALKSPSDPDYPFRLDGNQLRAARVLDYETTSSYAVEILCTKTETGLLFPLNIVVLLENMNDNPPVFDQTLYQKEITELSPIGSAVGRFAATDLDQHSRLYYTLTSEPTGFILQSPTNPEILVDAHLDYDTVKEYQLKLEVQDTDFASAPDGPSFSATTTIQITLSDGDNRPPWFQPCTKYVVGRAVICESAGYTGRVNLNEQETGVLSLKPGPVNAIDGDTGINEEITYGFLSGNDDGLFAINPSTGDITMLRSADVLGEVNLLVMAAQKNNVDQFATTQVVISVQVKSLHVPQFQKPLYEGLITSMGSVAVDQDKKALQILATDEDYAGVQGINPYITYSVEENNDFVIVNGFLFLINDVEDNTFHLTVVAKDTTNDETATAQLVMEVKIGISTSALPQSTTDIPTTTPGVNVNTVPPGGFRVGDMAALGATLGVLLLVCLVVIGVLFHRMKKDKGNWRKIYEASMFRSSLGNGPSDPKEAIQYTNEAFQRDEGGDGVDSGGPAGGLNAKADERPAQGSHYDKIISARLQSLQAQDTSDTDSHKADSEKEVKPILTKERRGEDGYKSVWFKEDIDPNAKEEVVIIPDNNEHDSEEEDNKPRIRDDDDDEEEGTSYKRKVGFADADLDSGLGVKIGDPGEDSESDRASNTSL
uniref:Cadherin-related family member 5-like n=1 Tax=Oryzias melastigma TaxID=30732 RepID=A0A3B3D7L5_ORYME